MKAEDKFLERNKQYIVSTGNKYFLDNTGKPLLFTDINGHQFKAKPDAMYHGLELLIEFKQGKLGNDKSYYDAENKKQVAMRFTTSPSFINNTMGWNHQLAKQVIVQKQLAQQAGMEMVVVFGKDTRESDLKEGNGKDVAHYKLLERYNSSGLEWIIEDELTYLAKRYSDHGLERDTGNGSGYIEGEYEVISLELDSDYWSSTPEIDEYRQELEQRGGNAGLSFEDENGVFSGARFTKILKAISCESGN